MGPDLPETLHYAVDDGVAVLRLRRADKRNALDDATVRGIGQFFADPPAGARAVVLHGEGDHFSAGLDLASLTERDTAAGIAHSRAWHRAFEQIEFGALPVVAVLHGAVVGGGLELAASAHIRVAEPSAFYALPEGSRGIYVGGGASVRLSRLIGVARMMDMMLTGRTYGAEEGVGLGFSQYLAAAGEGLARGIALARRAASNAPLTNFAILQALPRIATADPQTGLLMESLMAAIAQGSDEAKRLLRDFLEKRGAKVVHGP
ncbi:MAG: crotonase/enoyl-CoA hydratase family protein [Rhodospirillales bacterium]|nr:crotonase/enoyl-CoA hydratase family protein [Rhodospirillales bacterium]MDE2574091.1 crotonase/enoyl-CoA hydratase family protein [Rhodospirillales bacterium]